MEQVMQYIEQTEIQTPPLVVPSHGHIFGMIIAGFVVFLLPVSGAVALNYVASRQTQSLVSPVAQQSYIPAITTSAESTDSSNDLEYELSLANRFLAKAIDLSNKLEQQTEQDKQNIVYLLNQGLESANRAISIAPSDARGYSSRGRIYQAISLFKPEEKALADADFAKATALGATNPTLAPTTQNPLELLPTKQAKTTADATAVVAGPQEEAQHSAISSSTDQNTTRGIATIQSGQTEVFVPYPKVQDNTQLYVTADKNRDNVTLFVKNKESGKGFTIGATSAISSSLLVTWWEVK